MADKNKQNTQTETTDDVQLQGGTYEVIRSRLQTQGKDLLARLNKLNALRKDVFGAIDTKLLNSERITTSNNCVPRDMVPIGDQFIFGYNVFVGLRTETTLEDIFAFYRWQDDTLLPSSLDMIQNETFLTDFKNLYKYYRHSTFVKFAVIGHHLFMVFRIGKSVNDIKTFKWLIRDGKLEYCDNRSDHEYVFPPQHEFEWRRVTQDMHRSGPHPHISIEDIVFVETTEGDLTIKVEDNTETGQGIYAETVDDPDQTLSDAEIYYSIIGNIVLLKIRPYQEKAFRYFVYNHKIQKAVRIDSIQEACVLLPEGHGLVFPKGYYLQTGQVKQFDTDLEDLIFEKRIASPNGEDYLYIFYNRQSGTYVLLSYNLIDQTMKVPIICNGYSFFEDGTLIFFRANGDAQKHHVLQIWNTPYYGPDYTIEVQADSDIYKIGNKSIVHCMAECMELITLINKEDTYAGLYVDIAKKAEDMADSYFWLGDEKTFNLKEPLAAIGTAATAAIDEYEKVVRTRRNTRQQIQEVHRQVKDTVVVIDYAALETIDEYVEHLSTLRTLRGQVVSLKDLRYADTKLIEALETEVVEHTDKLSEKCVQFLLDPASLEPYNQKTTALTQQVPQLEKVTEAKELQEQVDQAATQLDMLTEIVSNLKIVDATQTVAIIDNISLVYSQVNQLKSKLKNKLQELAAVEGAAEFASQIKLIDQSVINYLDVCDTPEKCDEYLTKTTVQLETLESRFADFDEFIVQLAEKREEVYNAFESRKLQLVQQRNQRASAVMAAAERILKGIKNRVNSMNDVNEINGYFASNQMIERVRENIAQLEDLGDSVKAEDVKGQLKTLQQDAIRQLKDKQALYEDGDNIIRFGEHRFSVNNQPLEGTIVRRDNGLYYHLTGTGFFEPVTDEAILAAKDLWQMEVLSESPDLYRAEYLAWQMIEHLDAEDPAHTMKDEPVEQLIQRVQTFMGPRFDEGYVKGVHDHDAARILQTLLHMRANIGLLRYPTRCRTLAVVFWHLFENADQKKLIADKLAAVGHIKKLFADQKIRATYIKLLTDHLTAFVESTGLFDASLVDLAAEYLFNELVESQSFVVSQQADALRKGFEEYLRKNDYVKQFAETVTSLSYNPVGTFQLLHDWIASYLDRIDRPEDADYIDEVAFLFFPESHDRLVVRQSIEQTLDGMVGSHPRIVQDSYTLNYCDFITRIFHHLNNVVPRFVRYQTAKKERVDQYAETLRLEEFQTRVLSTFVRNKLIDKVYLPLVGDNLAKQIGTADQTKRTDRQGLLLMISPPGYGKTTLMEYIANRLGLIFVKINGPAIGHSVTSFDPGEVTNMAAREELNKLNLAFEMGDNVMIYVDDIQHTNPEFLQKFISLCDAQRRVEGVYRGKSRTYDLRGKRVCVVMAGNPYTESGEKFKIPDMLSNRADTYNIGDIVGDNYNEFVLSFIENSLTSNPVLQSVAQRSTQDIYNMIRLAETNQQDGVEFEGNYSVDELNEYVNVLKKLFVVRDVVLKVNTQYIASAAQADEYRTEPPFLLQGSYRNMNRIAGRVLPVMNDAELWTLIVSSYEQDAQTLTSGAESNLLKFRELTERLDDTQAKRWNDIKKTFCRNKLLGGDTDDKVTQIVRQLNAFSAGLDSIRETIADGVTTMAKEEKPSAAAASDQVTQVGQQVLSRMNEVIEAIKTQGDQVVKAHIEEQKLEKAQEAKENSQMLVSVLEEQFKTLETWLIPVHHSDADRIEYFKQLMGRFETMVSGYTRLMDALKAKYEPLTKKVESKTKQTPKQTPPKKT